MLLANPVSALTVALVKDLQAAASGLGRQLETIYASTDGQIDAAFAALVQKPADALLLEPDPFLTSRRVQLAVLAARHRVAGDLFHPRVRRSRRADELWAEPCE